MAKFRIVLGVLLLLLGPLLFYIALDAETNATNLAAPTGAKGAALFDVLGAWGLLAVCLMMGVSEILTGWKLLKNRD